jgi:hypothetical protein
MSEIQRIPVPNDALDEAERQIKTALAEIDASYRRDAEPWLKRLADIEGMRQYRTYAIDVPLDGVEKVA